MILELKFTVQCMVPCTLCTSDVLDHITLFNCRRGEELVSYWYVKSFDSAIQM